MSFFLPDSHNTINSAKLCIILPYNTDRIQSFDPEIAKLIKYFCTDTKNSNSNNNNNNNCTRTNSFRPSLCTKSFFQTKQNTIRKMEPTIEETPGEQSIMIGNLSKRIDKLENLVQSTIRSITDAATKKEMSALSEMFDALNLESRGVLDRIEDIERKQSVDRENIKLHEESMLKHEEHDVKMDYIKKQLTDFNTIACSMDDNIQYLSEIYEFLLKESNTKQQEMISALENQAHIINAQQERIKALESLLRSPSTNNYIEENNRPQESIKQPVSKHIKQNERESPVVAKSSPQLPKKPDLKSHSNENIIKRVKPNISYHAKPKSEKLEILSSRIEKLLNSQRSMKLQIQQIYKTPIKDQYPITPFIWNIRNLNEHTQEAGLLFSNKFQVKSVDHVMGAVLDFSLPNCIGVYLTVLYNENNASLKCSLKAKFQVTLLNFTSPSKSYRKQFDDSGNIAFSVPTSGMNTNLYGLKDFVQIDKFDKFEEFVDDNSIQICIDVFPV